MGAQNWARTPRLKEERESCKKKRKEWQVVGCQGFDDKKNYDFLVNERSLIMVFLTFI